MTEEEHITRAMLLGMGFNKKYSYYFDLKRRDSWTGKTYYRVDANTLDEIDVEETRRRQSKTA